jgi:hypothetical protein
MWFTGGHPGAMAKILTNGDFGLDIKPNEQKYYDEIVEPIINKIIKINIPMKMQDIFDILSPIRRFDPNLLQYFIECGLLAWKKSPFELEDELLKTRLFGISDGFTTNDSTRQLLSIRTEKTQPHQFKKTCQKAIHFFQNELHRLDFRPELYAIEILFLNVQLLITDKDRQLEKFIPEFRKIVQYLKSAPAEKQILSSFKQYLLQDWELDFILNYHFPNCTMEKLLKEIL